MNFKLWLFHEEQSAIEDGTSTIPEIKRKKVIIPLVSTGEAKLGEILKKLFGEHDVQYKFDGCVNKQCLRSDASFLVKENNKRYEDNKWMIQLIANFYKANHNTFPTRSTNPKLGNWLNNKRSAYRGQGKAAIYDGEKEYGISLGLPPDWLDKQTNFGEEYNNIKIQELANFYKANNNTFPTRSTNPQLWIWLSNKRLAYRGIVRLTKYEGEKEYGIILGLPPDWLDKQTDKQTNFGEEYNNRMIQLIADFYKANNNTFPTKSTNSKLQGWLLNKRLAHRGIGNRAIYDGEKEYGISLGLPPDWLDKQINTGQEDNNKMIQLLADFYKANHNTFPKRSTNPKLSYWLDRKRLAYRGKGRYAKYEGEKEYGISLGLPENWLESNI